jgi:hypothetical protein
VATLGMYVVSGTQLSCSLNFPVPVQLYVEATFTIPGKIRIPKEFWTLKTPDSFQDHSIAKSSGAVFSS